MSTPSEKEMERFVWHQEDCDHNEGECTCDYHLRLEQFRVDLAALVASARAEALEEAARCIETQYRRELDSLHEEDDKHDTWAIIGRVRVRDAAAIRALAAKGKA